jgi:hypothetical protein
VRPAARVLRRRLAALRLEEHLRSAHSTRPRADQAQNNGQEARSWHQDLPSTKDVRLWLFTGVGLVVVDA